MSYAERARRYLEALQSEPHITAAPYEINEINEKRGDEAVWWHDRGAATPILMLPPATCIAPIACSRLGPCDRHADGQPCQVAGEPA